MGGPPGRDSDCLCALETGGGPSKGEKVRMEKKAQGDSRTAEMRGKALREALTACLGLLEKHLFLASLAPFSAIPPMRRINTLFPLLLHPTPLVHWRAVTALGQTVGQLFSRDPDGAREVVRRLMWQMNEESGGIGWGCPEAMGEILASEPGLARDYAPILISTIRKDGNYLDQEVLLQGALWGIGRLSRENPRLTREAAPHIRAFLASPAPLSRGLALWGLGSLAPQEVRDLAPAFFEDRSPLVLYRDLELQDLTVAHLAREAAGLSGPVTT